MCRVRLFAVARTPSELSPGTGRRPDARCTAVSTSSLASIWANVSTVIGPDVDGTRVKFGASGTTIVTTPVADLPPTLSTYAPTYAPTIAQMMTSGTQRTTGTT